MWIIKGKLLIYYIVLKILQGKRIGVRKTLLKYSDIKLVEPLFRKQKKVKLIKSKEVY